MNHLYYSAYLLAYIRNLVFQILRRQHLHFVQKKVNRFSIALQQMCSFHCDTTFLCKTIHL